MLFLKVIVSLVRLRRVPLLQKQQMTPRSSIICIALFNLGTFVYQEVASSLSETISFYVMNFFSSASKTISQAGEKAARSTREFSDIFTPNDDKLQRIIKKDEPPLLSGILWKRRGGLGAKLGSWEKAWERRYVELRGNVLLYYETAGEETNKTLTGTERSVSSSPKDPRGYLDLAEEKAATQATYGHSGAPSPFCISIKVGLAQETKWKLCFDHHQTQMKWLVAISDATIRCSVDDYNQALLKAANPNTHEASLLPRSPPVYEPGTGGQEKVHTLWSLEEYTVTNSTHAAREEDKSQVETPTPSTTSSDTAPLDNALQVMETLLAQKEKARVALEQTVSSLQQEVEALKASAKERESKIAAIATENDSHKEKLASLVKELLAKEKTIKAASEGSQALASLKEELREKESRIKELEKNQDELQVEFKSRMEALEEEKCKTETKQQKLLWALKEEFRTTLEAQSKENEELRAALKESDNSMSTPKAPDKVPSNDEEEDEFEDCVG
eukprot:scaffold91_cov127-Cylindrotheca_fusiformis.AAC.12